MSTKITRINQIAKERPKEVFTSVYHLINLELLRECFKELDGNKATGLDDVTKDMYCNNLEENLNNIVDRLKTKSIHMYKTIGEKLGKKFSKNIKNVLKFIFPIFIDKSAKTLNITKLQKPLNQPSKPSGCQYSSSGYNIGRLNGTMEVWDEIHGSNHTNGEYLKTNSLFKGSASTLASTKARLRAEMYNPEKVENICRIECIRILVKIRN